MGAMWVEAILSKGDLTALVAQFTPLKLRLGEDGELLVTEPGEVDLVPDVGLRVACKAKLKWPVLGVRVPATLNSLIVIVRPEIVKTSIGEALLFKLQIEHIDVAGLPAMIDDGILDHINRELATRHVDLTWDFTSTLSHSFPLPEVLQPLGALGLDVAWGKLKVTHEAVAFAISYHSHVNRRSEDHGSQTPRLPEPGAEDAPLVVAPERGIDRPEPGQEPGMSGKAAVTVGLTALALVGFLALGRSLARQWSE